MDITFSLEFDVEESNNPIKVAATEITTIQIIDPVMLFHGGLSYLVDMIKINKMA